MFGIKTRVKRFYNRTFYYPFIWEKTLQRRAEQLQQKDVITVAFIAMNISMWKYQYFYDLLKKNPRFKLYIIISPSVKFSHDVMVKDAEKMRQFFSERDMEYIDWDLEHGDSPVNIRETINPDILFYTQPGKKVHTSLHSYRQFKDKLLCYAPYGFQTHKTSHIYDRDFLNIAWKLYYYTNVQHQLAKTYNLAKGRNSIVCGYLDYDRFIQGPFIDVWKKTDRELKKVIWAPHFTISGSLIKNFQPRSTFLEICDIMLDIAERYADKLQIAFKPHPRLLTELYNHPNWGKEKADNYYKKWQEMPNGQLETGDFVNLFHFSDALIHDSGSFVMDYMYFDKPEMFLTDDIQSYINEADDLAKNVYNNIYYGKTKESIINFIDTVVLNNKDIKRLKRKEIVETYMLPPNGRLASENMYLDLCKSLGING